MKILKPFLAAATVFSLAACGNSGSQNSSLDGHYENSSANLAANYANKQVVVPEYEAVESVMVSLPLIRDYGREDLVAAILNAGAEKVYVSISSRDGVSSLNSSVFNRLRNLIGSAGMGKIELLRHNLPASARKTSSTVWARDWAPLGARAVDAFSELRVVDFNYYPDRVTDDFAPQAIEQLEGFERVSVPVYNEGGNFMNNSDGVCMMSTRVVEGNSRRYVSDDLILSPSQIKSYYNTYAGCEETIIIERMPFEGTGHIDMLAKFLNNDTLIVSQMRPETLVAIERSEGRNSDSYFAAIEMRDYLEGIAAQFSRRFNVIRIPMPAPNADTGVDFTVVRSYTNSLLVNGTAIVPRYVRGAVDQYGRVDYAEGSLSFTSDNLLYAYEREVEAAYASQGYNVVWIESDELISNGGAVHCVTMQLPKL